MSFAGTFSYLNNIIYGVTINANMDLRIEKLGHISGIAKVYFTDATLPLRTSNPIPPPPGFAMVDSMYKNNIAPENYGVPFFLIAESRGYDMSLNGQPIFSLRTQIQECTILRAGISHFTIP
ncbi:904_t:CDS:2 [Funneliformis geosporum]|uniref:8003_t:CDS:1 n=1 Tax=Funneliformis geosporum TaxID=1117311 RepID=A0A9W4WTG8_9GLOM|nr:904_t:CDS:2 [Funneliformis geosporum]CAI2177720.1 8003_t:CDS:2 [Funneliformis geosporum]